MDILFIADPLADFKIYKDTTYAMMAEAARRGHTLFACEPSDLAYRGGAVEARVMAFSIVPAEQRVDGGLWYLADAGPGVTRLTEFDAVLMRKDPPFDMEYVTSS